MLATPLMTPVVACKVKPAGKPVALYVRAAPSHGEGLGMRIKLLEIPIQ